MYQQKHRIKAAFLLLVFALNTVVSFACSVGMIDFSKDHHKNSPQQAGAGQHSHDVKRSHGAKHSHDESHSHGKAPRTQSENPSKGAHSETTAASPNEDDDNCCSDDVVKISILDKTVTSVNQNPLPTLVEVIAAVYAYILPGYHKAALLIKPKPPSDRSWTASDHTTLRIAIQSFQI